MSSFLPHWLLVACLAVLLISVPPQASAEELPTKGTFRGIYDENHAGVGHFSYYIVPVELTQTFTPYKGKYIEVEVLAARQPINPGPAVLEKVGKITELSAAPLEIEITTIAPGSGGRTTFDVLYTLRNSSKEPIDLDANSISIGLGFYREVKNPAAIDDFLGTGYSAIQLAYADSRTQPWNFFHPTSSGRSPHFYTGRVRLGAGESVPFVWHGVPGSCLGSEVIVSATHQTDKKEAIPVVARKILELPPPDGKKPKPPLTVKATAAREDEWLTVEGKLINETDFPRWVFVKSSGKEVFLPVLVELLDKKGEYLAQDLTWQEPGGPWVRKLIDKDGLAFRFRVRQSYHFAKSQEDHIDFWLLTDNGVEKLTVVRDLPPRPIIAEPPWGETVKGCRCRVSLKKDRFVANEPIRFVFQADSDRKQADVLWINPGNGASHVVVEIDGKPVRIFSGGVPDGNLHTFSSLNETTLAHDLGLSPGKHKLRMTVRGDGGTYTNLNNDTVRKFEGTLISNEVEFAVVK